MKSIFMAQYFQREFEDMYTIKKNNISICKWLIDSILLFLKKMCSQN